MERDVLLLATKDTMAYARRPGHEAVASGAELLATVPADRLPARVCVEDVLAEPSWDISPASMLTLARRARDAIADDGFAGVVVAHGTDTLEETAYLTDLLAGAAARRGRIVFTGAVRHLDDLGSDGPRNLAAAITAAAAPGLTGAGVLVCADDELHAARWVAKVDATGGAPFSSAPMAPVARVAGGSIEPLTAPPPRPPEAAGEVESDVALIKTYPGIDPALLTAVVDAGARGVVLEGTGAGNVPVGLFGAIAELTSWDIPVVVASRCRTRVAGLEELGLGAGLAARMGAIGARGLSPGKARVALMVALGGTSGGRGDSRRGGDNGNGSVAAARRWFASIH